MQRSQIINDVTFVKHCDVTSYKTMKRR